MYIINVRSELYLVTNIGLLKHKICETEKNVRNKKNSKRAVGGKKHHVFKAV